MVLEDNRPIAVLDSGLGGLRLCKRLSSIYKKEDILYFADNLYMPYGNKTKKQITNRLRTVIDYLIAKYNIKMLIIACNTATISALKEIKNEYKIQIIGVEPYKKLYSNSIILCTTLTSKEINNSLPIKNLALYIEDNYFDKAKIKRYIMKLVQNNSLEKYSNIILGCTHYELVADIFKECLPNCHIILASNFILEKIMRYNTLKVGNGKSIGNIHFLMSKYTKSYYDKMVLIFNTI